MGFGPTEQGRFYREGRAFRPASEGGRYKRKEATRRRRHERARKKQICACGRLNSAFVGQAFLPVRNRRNAQPRMAVPPVAAFEWHGGCDHLGGSREETPLARSLRLRSGQAGGVCSARWRRCCSASWASRAC